MEQLGFGPVALVANFSVNMSGRPARMLQVAAGMRIGTLLLACSFAGSLVPWCLPSQLVRLLSVGIILRYCRCSCAGPGTSVWVKVAVHQTVVHL